MEFSVSDTGVDSGSLLQGISLTQELNRGLVHCRHIFYQLSYQGSPDWYPTTGKPSFQSHGPLLAKGCLCFSIQPRPAMALLPGSEWLLIPWLQSPSTAVLERREENMSLLLLFPSICHEVVRLDVVILVFSMLSFKPAFSLSSFTFIKRLFSSSSLSAI